LGDQVPTDDQGTRHSPVQDGLDSLRIMVMRDSAERIDDRFKNTCWECGRGGSHGGNNRVKDPREGHEDQPICVECRELLMRDD
jgi:hypothetical protein